MPKLKFSSNQYEVGLPWTRDPFDMPDHFQMCFNRLMSLQQRLLKEPQILTKYDQTICDQLKKGIVERVPDVTITDQQPHNLIHYMLHLPVIRKERSTTKVRVVYDGHLETLYR